MSRKRTVKAESTPPVNPEPTDLPPAGRAKPLVFISHDTRDADIAEAFANLLQDASGGVLRSFRSSDRRGTSGIEFGAEWYSAIMTRLQDATDVVALLTAQSLGRPWLLYEAGVAKGRLDTVVFGVALGVPLDQAGIGPFAQFQNSGDDEDSLTKLVLQLIRRNPDADPREEAVRRQVIAFQAAVAGILEGRTAPPQRPAQEFDAGAVAKLFEEVKIMFRQLPDQLEQSIERRLRNPASHQMLVGPGYVSDLFDRLAALKPGEPGKPFLEAARVARQVHPALYRALLDVRRAWAAGDPEPIVAALEGMRRRISQKDMLDEDVSAYPYLRDFIPMLDYFARKHLDEAAAGAPTTQKRKSGKIGDVQGA